MSSETSNAHICEFCNKGFSSKGSLKTHIETVCNRSEDLQLNCLYCNIEFSRKSTLDSHIKQCSKKDEYELKIKYDTLVKEFDLYKQTSEQSYNQLKSLYDQETKKKTLQSARSQNLPVSLRVASSLSLHNPRKLVGFNRTSSVETISKDVNELKSTVQLLTNCINTINERLLKLEK
jgi:hypothetical protein